MTAVALHRVWAVTPGGEVSLAAAPCPTLEQIVEAVREVRRTQGLYFQAPAPLDTMQKRAWEAARHELNGLLDAIPDRMAA